MVKKSTVQVWFQYITAILLIFLLTWHLVIRVPWLRGVGSFEETLKPQLYYHEVTAYGVLLVIFAYVVLLHAFNGLRNMLLEWTSGRYNGAITAIIVILFIIFASLATYTVVGVTPPPSG
jgi:succinate dehydrogenase / fumarate reductase membrane anchor subunit